VFRVTGSYVSKQVAQYTCLVGRYDGWDMESNSFYFRQLLLRFQCLLAPPTIHRLEGLVKEIVVQRAFSVHLLADPLWVRERNCLLLIAMLRLRVR
jgi:hypothetical protein